MRPNEPEAVQPASPPRGHVVSKAALLIVIVGATGIALLAERQRRFEAAHAMTMAHRQADTLEREIRKLRAEVADRLTPARLDTMSAGAEPLHPILWVMGTAPEPME